jgi:6-phosphogluconolactonase
MKLKPIFSSIALFSAVVFHVFSHPLLPVKSHGTAIKKTRSVMPAKPLLLFVGTQTDDEKSPGIYWYEMNPFTGALTYISVSPKTVNPTYLAIHPNHQWLYAVNETGDGKLSAFRIDMEKKQLVFINSMSSYGSSPCHISIDKSGKYVMVANYSSGSIAVYPIGTDGSLGDATSKDRHQGKDPHAHMIMQADNGFVYNTDLGTDQIFIYKLDTVQGKFTATGNTVNTHPGAGPRHLAFHTNQKWAYVINELNGTIEAFTVTNGTGAFTRFQIISTLAEGETREPGSGDIHISPDGKYLYATNRGDINDIVMFTIDQQSGQLKLLGHQPTKGIKPRNFVIDPSGKFLLVANQNSGNVVIFCIDPDTGVLKDSGMETSIPGPMCLKFME